MRRGSLVWWTVLLAIGGGAAVAGAVEGVDCAALPTVASAEPAELREACPAGPLPGWVSPDIGRFPTDTGWAQQISGVISNDDFVTFTLNDFPNQTIVGQQTAAIYGMDFDPSATTLWALNGDTNELGTYDLATGAFTGVVAATPPGGGSWTGLSIDSAGVFWASTADTLVTIDPGTGTVTTVGAFGITDGIMIDIAINLAGEMYGHDISTDSIYSIDTATGAATLVGATGYDSNYAQGMDFDFSDGTLYIWTYQGSGANAYGTVDLATGAVTALASSNPQGEFEGAVQVPAGEQVGCGLDPVEFEEGIPLTFSVVNNTGAATVWTTNDDTICPRTNDTGGTGFAACADSDTAGSGGGAYDTELISNTFDLSAASAATLTFNAYYNDLTTDVDYFMVDIWNGASWDNLLTWDEDHFGEAVSLDLAAYAGMSGLQIRFVYEGDGWDWYVLVDTVQITCTLPAITLDMTLGTSTGVCGTDDLLVVAPGTTVTYCYTVTNTGNTALELHDLTDSAHGSLFTGFSQTLAPAASYEYTYDATANATTDHTATWTAYNAGPVDVATDDATSRVVVSGPMPLVCNGTTVGFDAGIPPDWTVVNNASGNPVEWTDIAGAGESGNYTNGIGDAATASSDLQGGGSGLYDTELITPAFDTTGLNFVELSFTANYQNYAFVDYLDVDVSTDGGTTWTNVMSWNEDHPSGALRSIGNGEDVVLDISTVAGNQASVLIRWHYYDPTGPASALDWYAQIDEAALTCAIPVELQSFSIE